MIEAMPEMPELTQNAQTSPTREYKKFNYRKGCATTPKSGESGRALCGLKNQATIKNNGKLGLKGLSALDTPTRNQMDLDRAWGQAG